jgi:hypothetical protein
MNALQRTPSPDPAVLRAVGHLRRAEVDLLAVVHAGTHPDNAILLEAHAFLWEAISALSNVLPPGERGTESCDVRL